MRLHLHTLGANNMAVESTGKIHIERILKETPFAKKVVVYDLEYHLACIRCGKRVTIQYAYSSSRWVPVPVQAGD